MEFSYLSNLEGDAENWLVRVRVCRLWEAVNTKDNNLISMDMILIDEKESLMHAAIRRHLVPRFKHRVKEGLIYSLRNVKVAPNTNQYRPLASDQRMLFLATTEVVELGEDVVPIPKYGFQFVDLPMLQSRAGNMTTLSGALTFASTSASKVYVNPDVDHVSSIRERFSALPPKIVAIEGPSSARLPPEEAMFVNRMTVEALVRATCAGELKVDVVTLKATITAINNRFKWYYVSCQACVRRATLQDGVFVCNNCNQPIDHPLVMFYINVQVEDGTGTTTVVLLNSTAERLLDTSAKKLMNKLPACDDSVPPELQVLLCREYVYKLKLNKYNLVDGLQDYGVSALFTPVEELETAYERKMDTFAQALEGSSAGSIQESCKLKRKLCPAEN